MTGDITRLPPARRGEKSETERQKRIREIVARLIPVWMVRKAGEKLVAMGDRWESSAYAESYREELDAVLSELAYAEEVLTGKLANGVT